MSTFFLETIVIVGKKGEVSSVSEGGQMVHIHPVDTKPVFTLDEAREALAVIYKLTVAANDKVAQLMTQLEVVTNESIRREIEAKISTEVDQWEEKVSKLGARPKGLWLADFDSGYGYYCWKFPEMGINYWHSYQDGFSGRKRLMHIENTLESSAVESCACADQSHPW